MRDLRWFVGFAGSLSGPGAVDIGIFYWHPVVVYGSLALLLPKSFCVQGAGVGLARLWSRPVSVDRLTVLPVLRPSGS